MMVVVPLVHEAGGHKKAAYNEQKIIAPEKHGALHELHTSRKGAVVDWQRAQLRAHKGADPRRLDLGHLESVRNPKKA